MLCQILPDISLHSEGPTSVVAGWHLTGQKGAQRALGLIEQQNVLHRFADDGDYKVVDWYVEGDGV